MFQRNYRPGQIGFMGTKRINWASLLNNTQKTLNIINQAIPIIYQVKPIINNAKTMFKVISAVKDEETPSHGSYHEETGQTTQTNMHPHYDNKPIFYI